MKTFIEFLIENNSVDPESSDAAPELLYYSSDSFSSTAHHDEHMLLKHFSPYRKAFQTTLDDTGSHPDAHKAGVTAVINIPTPEPHWDGNSYVKPEHPVTQLVKLNPRVRAVTPELGTHIDTKA